MSIISTRPLTPSLSIATTDSAPATPAISVPPSPASSLGSLGSSTPRSPTELEEALLHVATSIFDSNAEEIDSLKKENADLRSRIALLESKAPKDTAPKDSGKKSTEQKQYRMHGTAFDRTFLACDNNSRENLPCSIL